MFLFCSQKVIRIGVYVAFSGDKLDKFILKIPNFLPVLYNGICYFLRNYFIHNLNYFSLCILYNDRVSLFSFFITFSVFFFFFTIVVRFLLENYFRLR